MQPAAAARSRRQEAHAGRRPDSTQTAKIRGSHPRLPAHVLDRFAAYSKPYPCLGSVSPTHESRHTSATYKHARHTSTTHKHAHVRRHVLAVRLVRYHKEYVACLSAHCECYDLAIMYSVYTHLCTPPMPPVTNTRIPASAARSIVAETVVAPSRLLAIMAARSRLDTFDTLVPCRAMCSS